MRHYRNHIGMRIAAAVLCLCTVLTMFAGLGGFGTLEAQAAETGGTAGVTRQADPSTMDTYQEMLDFSKNTRYAGRLWSDKTVFALGDNIHDNDPNWDGQKLTLNMADDGVSRTITLDEDFLHVYSVLGSSEQNNTQTTIPLDLVMVLDVSGSMGNAANQNADPNPNDNLDMGPSKIYQSVKAMNDAIDRLMKLNPQNRVGVVLFSSYSQVLMPLAHYDPIEGDRSDAVSTTTRNYIRITDNYNYSNQDNNAASSNADYYLYGFQSLQPGGGYGYNSISNGTLYTGQGFHDDDDGNGTGGYIGSNTNIDSGMWRGLNMLLNSTSTTTMISGKPYSVLPAFVFLGDGDPQIMMATTAAGQWWSPNQDSCLNDGMFDDPPIILNTVMRTALMKAAVIKHYRDAAEEVEATNLASVDLAFNTVGISLGQVGHGTYGTPTATALLNPSAAVNGFNRSNTALRNSRYVVQEAYNTWNTWSTTNTAPRLPTIYAGYQASSQPTYNQVFNQLPSNQISLHDVTVTKQDVINNIYYTDTFFDANTADQIADAFQSIVDATIGITFVPVAGENDLGVNNSITFMDPMGKYMEVKDIKGVSLFGQYHGITKTAVYDYQWNDLYMKYHGGQGVTPLPAGWYRGDPSEDPAIGNTNVDYQATLNGMTAEQAWAAGWVYRVGYTTAAQFVPTLDNIYDVGDMLTKEKQTVYTFYRLTDPQADRQMLYMNPAYGTTGVPDGVVYDGATQAHLNTAGVYALADMRIWVENTGDYNDDHPALESDANYDEALWVNIPANMLPLRKITINEGVDGNYTYETNIPSEGTTIFPNTPNSASFPLRVYYTVGVSDEVLENGRINMAGAIDAEYTMDNKISSADAAAARGIAQGNVEFFSNWYNPLKRYSDYATSATDFTYGDPVTSFSPDSGNRYYAFQRALPLYSHAYIWVQEESAWRRVAIDERDAGEDARTFLPTEFGGRLVKDRLDAVAGSDVTTNTDNINQALQAAGFDPSNLQDQDIVLLESDILDDVTKNGTDPFPSEGYFFLAIDFYNLEKGSKNATYTQYVIARKGSEFGSAYRSAGISNGDMLVWHDMSGQYPDYPYLSATDTGDNTRGKTYLGWPLDATGYFVDCDKKENEKPTDLSEAAYAAAKAKVPESDAGKYEATWEAQQTAVAEGDWVVCAKPGGLRVGDLSQAVQQKDGAYESNANIDAYYKVERYPEESGLNWGFYASNVTRTANNYYMPTISTGSTSSDVRVNTYLGNNGRLYIMDTTLLVTKLVEDPASHALINNEDEFNYQVYIDGVTGLQSAIVVKYMGEDGMNGSWQRQFHYIDLQLDTQLFLQTKDGQKAMVDVNGNRLVSSSTSSGYAYVDGTEYNDSDGGPYYVFIGKNRNTVETAGLTDTSFRVYHNDEVDQNGTVGTGDVTVDSGGAGTKGTFSAATVWLVSMDTFTNSWEGLDPVGEAGFNIGNHSDKTLNNFELMTIDPSVHDETSALSFHTPYLTASAYWTEEVFFGQNANPDGDGKDASHATMTADDLYDQIIPIADRPDLIPSDLTNGEIAQYTAEFRLKNGYGLLFSGISSGSVYRVTEKLTDEQMDMGYTLKRVSHTQQVGSTSTYQPGKQRIPVYYNTGTTYGDIYPTDLAKNIPDLYRGNPTQYGLTWAVKQDGSTNDASYRHTEPFFNTNAVVWEAYSTMDATAQGDNHHQPTSVPDGESVFWLWHSDTNQNENTNTTQRIDRHTVMDNPSCVPLAQGGCDEDIGGGQVRHYFFKDGALLDQHYYGEGSGYLRDFARFVTSPTVHFAVKDEPAQVNRNPAEFPFTSSTNYTGVYSVFGNTGTFEESANFVNTISNDKTETQINGGHVEHVPGDENKNLFPGVQPGDEITYEITWSNATKNPAHIVIVDQLDEGVNFVSATVTDNAGNVLNEYEGKYYANQTQANAALAEIYKDAKQTLTVDSGHVVIWDLGEQAAEMEGKAVLTVKVNQSAAEWWDYDGDGVADAPTGTTPEPDYLVRNRATVRVADNVYHTNTVVNPVGEPDKTETLIERGELGAANSSELTEDVTEGDNLLSGDDGKWHGPLVFPGDKITYEITWRNYKSEDATISIRDPLDPNVKFVSATYDPASFKDSDGKDLVTTELEVTDAQTLSADPNNGDAKTARTVSGYTTDEGAPETRNTITYTAKDAAENAHTVVFNLGEMPAGSSGKVTLVVEVLPGATPVGYVDNTAYVAVNGDPEQRTKTVENPTPQEEKTEVTPGDGVLVGVGEEITYNIHWNNYKSETARIVVMDTLDPGVDFKNADGEPNGTYYPDGGTLAALGEYGAVEIPKNTVVWDLGVQDANEKGTVNLTVTVNEKAKLDYKYNETADGLEHGTGTDGNEKDYEVLNQARVKVGNDGFVLTQVVENPVPEKDETNIDHTPSGGEVDPDLALTPKEDEDNTFTGPQVYVGDKITYTVHWSNHEKNEGGEFIPADVTVTDPLDKGVNYVEGSAKGPDADKVTGDVNVKYDPARHTLTWTFKAKPNTDGVVTFDVAVNEKATPTGFVRNQATVQVGNRPGVKTEAIENPTPKVEKTEVIPGEGMQVMPGDDITYEITWRNYEEKEATVTVRDKLDPGLDFLSAFFKDFSLTNPDSAKKPETANLVISLEGEGTEPIAFTLELTAPTGKTLAESYDFENTNGTTGLWLASSKNVTLKPGETVTVKDLPVGTQFVLKQGEKEIASAALGTYGSAVQVKATATIAAEPTVSIPQPTNEAAGGEVQADPPVTQDPADPANAEAQAQSTEEQDGAETQPATIAATDPIASMGELVGIPVPDGEATGDPANEPDTEPSDGSTADGQEGTPELGTDPEQNDVPMNGTEPEQSDPPANEPEAAPENGTEYIFTGVVIDLPSPMAEEPVEETADATSSFKDDFGIVTIKYYAASHTVEWVLEGRPAYSLDAANGEGVVRLTVRVNDDAMKFWSYEHPEWGPSESETDKRVRNQAGVQVGTDPEVKTRIIENPTEPEKRETMIEDRDVSQDLVADDLGYIGPQVFVGDTVTYTVTWQNNARGLTGEVIPAWIVVVDPLDDGVDFVEASSVGVYTATDTTLTREGYDPVNVPAHSVYWDFGIQAPRTRGRETLKVLVNSKALPEGATAGEIVNTASVRVNNDTQYTDRVLNPVGAFGALTVTKHVTGDLADKEKEFHFTVTLEPLLGQVLNGMYGEMEFVDNEATFTLKDGESRTATHLPPDANYTVVEQEANEDGYTTTTAGKPVGTIPQGDTAEVEFVNWKGTGPEKEEVTPGDGKAVHVDDEITYKITWENYDAEAARVIIRDPLDVGVDFVSASDGGTYYEEETEIAYGEEPEEKMTVAAHSVVWLLGEREAGETGEVTLAVRVNEQAEDAGKVVNVAYVKVGNHAEQGTQKPENPLPGPHKTEVTPGNGQTVSIGTEIQYRIDWLNYQSEAARVIVMDTLDPGVDFVSADNGGEYHETAGQLGEIEIPAHTVVWDLGEQPAAMTGSVTLTVRVNEKATLDYTYNGAADGFAGGEGTDDRVYNQARVKVGDDPFEVTEIPENPVKPTPTPTPTPTPPPSYGPMPTPNPSNGPRETPVPGPQTGDTRNFKGWIALMAATMLGTVCLGLALKVRSRKTPKHMK